VHFGSDLVVLAGARVLLHLATQAFDVVNNGFLHGHHLTVLNIQTCQVTVEFVVGLLNGLVRIEDSEKDFFHLVIDVQIVIAFPGV